MSSEYSQHLTEIWVHYSQSKTDVNQETWFYCYNETKHEQYVGIKLIVLVSLNS